MGRHRETTVFFLVPSLRGGGAERVTLQLIAGLDRGRFSPTLIVAQLQGAYRGSVPDDTEIIALDRSRMRYTLLDLVHILRERRPVILFSVMRQTNTVALLAKALSAGGTRIVVTEHNTLSIAIQEDDLPTIRLALLRRLYPRADAIVAVSDGVAEDMCRVLGLARSAVTRIYNPVVNASLLAKASEKPAHPWFSVDRRLPVVLACGSLTQKKGFDYLIRAVAHLQRDIPARLVILGEGEQRAKLRELAEELHVQDKVAMPGFQDNPYGSMARADVFVLSSLWEGLGNVVIEAMACGAPVVSTDCPSGPAEIITHNVDGILVPPADSNALSAAILSLLRDERLGQRLARAGRARAADFRVSKIVDHYQDLFAGLVGDQADR